MCRVGYYESPLGSILLAADAVGITGAWFEGQKYFARGLTQAREEETQVLFRAKCWLDIYFSGREPDFTPPLHPAGTEFQQRVWEQLSTIPYGQTLTYGALARRLGCKSAQAVGGAVGRNPISVLIPCHRVVGSGGSLTGYAGGLERKTALLALERGERP